jgi:hypothetical protein
MSSYAVLWKTDNGAPGVALTCGAFATTASADSSQAGCRTYGAFIANTAQTLNAQQPGGGRLRLRHCDERRGRRGRHRDLPQEPDLLIDRSAAREIPARPTLLGGGPWQQGHSCRGVSGQSATRRPSPRISSPRRAISLPPLSDKRLHADGPLASAVAVSLLHALTLGCRWLGPPTDSGKKVGGPSGRRPARNSNSAALSPAALPPTRRPPTR